jgi:hypothetical protein
MSAQLKSVNNEAFLPTELLFALDKAEHLSLRSGWGWSLTRLGKRVQSGSGMFGYPETGLLSALSSGTKADTLFLSSPPHDGFLSWDELLPKLRSANIRELTIPQIESPWWIFNNYNEIDNALGIKINRCPMKGIGSQLYYGPYTLKTKSRPWVTCVTSSALSERFVGLASFTENFGFKQRILRKVLSSHALVTDPRIDCQYFEKENNNLNCQLLKHTYSDIDDFKCFLTQLAQLDLSTLVVIACDDICSELVRLGLVDEISVSYELISEHSTFDSHYSPMLSQNWQVIDCSPLLKGVNVELINKPF